jgi:hypothetical protein
MNNVSGINLIFSVIGQAIADFGWIILPVMFYYIFKILWIDYVLAYAPDSWMAKQAWTMLEVIPPREIERGPKMMENIFTGMTGVLTTPNTFDKYLKGFWPQDRFGLELVGEEGKAHFYFRMQKKYRKMMEAHIYAQYPDAEILEVEDYYNKFPRIVPNKDWDMWGADFDFVNKDPIPIKTYDKFEESVTGEMIDPMAALVENLGALGPGQHIWLQFVLEPIPEPEAKKKYADVLKKLKGEAVPEVMGPFGHLWDVFKNIPKGFLGPVEFKAADKKDLGPLEFRLSPMEKDLLKATEENLGKNLFKTKLRFIYLARRENFDGTLRSSFIGGLKQFNDINFNQIKPEEISKTYGKIFFTKSRGDFRKRKLYDRYRRRNMDGVNVVFSTKELATMFHFPDMHVKSPAVQRTAAKLGAAPANLPIE